VAYYKEFPLPAWHYTSMRSKDFQGYRNFVYRQLVELLGLGSIRLETSTTEGDKNTGQNAQRVIRTHGKNYISVSLFSHWLNRLHENDRMRHAIISLFTTVLL
jgi:hypothetical protein